MPCFQFHAITLSDHYNTYEDIFKEKKLISEINFFHLNQFQNSLNS